MNAGIAPALVDVDPAVRSVEPVVAVASKRVVEGDAFATVARVAGAVIGLVTVHACKGEYCWYWLIGVGIEQNST